MAAIWERRSRDGRMVAMTPCLRQSYTAARARTFVSWLLIYYIARARGILFPKNKAGE